MSGAPIGRPVAIAAGGTGGHMFPALALAAELRARGQRAVILCDARGARYLGEGIEHRLIQAASPTGGPGRRLAGLARLALGFGQSLAALHRLKPSAVAALGGYASVPVGLAARCLRLPVLLHEQNAVLGRANRLLLSRAARLALTFARTRGADAVPEARCVLTGNPVRAEVLARRGQAYEAPRPGEPLNVLVIGGSQGARVLSDAVPAAIALLTEAERGRIRLTQQCRPEDLERVASAYAALGFEAELASFFHDLPERLAETHLVISRAGASSVAEILAIGRPALLVPFRFAADDHQTANAQAVVAEGAGWLIGEAELSGEALAERLRTVLEEPGQLAAMAARARALGRPDAAQLLADAVQALVSPSGARLELEALA
jgi:UDP-N-acetylglucosamine--N-acetylmuramyl-(pentapeptide) pyrophosphoryl-undecaprenol N-acetylglucosamine transferase